MNRRTEFGGVLAVLGSLAALVGMGGLSGDAADREVEGLLQALADDRRMLVASRIAVDIPSDPRAAAWQKAQPLAVPTYPQRGRH